MDCFQLLGKDVLNKIFLICARDLDSIKKTSNVAHNIINTRTIPYLIGDFLGKLNVDVLNKIFIQCSLVDDHQTVSNLRRTCKYIDTFFNVRTLPSIIRLVEEKKVKLLSDENCDRIVKDIIAPMRVRISKRDNYDESDDEDGGQYDDGENDNDDGENYDREPKRKFTSKKCNICHHFTENKVVIDDSDSCISAYCYQCFLCESFIVKAIPPLEVYAVNYNFLRIASGLGGLSYSN